MLPVPLLSSLTNPGVVYFQLHKLKLSPSFFNQAFFVAQIKMTIFSILSSSILPIPLCKDGKHLHFKYKWHNLLRLLNNIPRIWKIQMILWFFFMELTSNSIYYEWVWAQDLSSTLRILPPSSSPLARVSLASQKYRKSVAKKSTSQAHTARSYNYLVHSPFCFLLTVTKMYNFPYRFSCFDVDFGQSIETKWPRIQYNTLCTEVLNWTSYTFTIVHTKKLLRSFAYRRSAIPRYQPLVISASHCTDERFQWHIPSCIARPSFFGQISWSVAKYSYFYDFCYCVMRENSDWRGQGDGG